MTDSISESSESLVTLPFSSRGCCTEPTICYFEWTRKDQKTPYGSPRRFSSWVSINSLAPCPIVDALNTLRVRDCVDQATGCSHHILDWLQR